MKQALRLSVLSLVTAMISIALVIPTHATVGYFQLGHGSLSNAMSGATIAFVRDSIAVAVNPSGLHFIEEGLDLSLMGFMPERGGELDTFGIFGEAYSSTSENPFFLAPNVGGAWRINRRWVVGFSLYSSGGMNTEYKTNLYHQSFAAPTALFSAAVAGANGFEVNGEEHKFVEASFLNASNTGTLGVNLEQAVLAPSIAYKMNDQLSLGFSMLVGFQRFSAQGLGDFVSFSTSPLQLSDRGPDYSAGVGARVGVTYTPLKRLSMGAVASSKIYMSPFEKYSGLFAGRGDFDVPSHFGLGLAAELLRGFTLSVDLTHINYEGVSSVSNPGPDADLLLSGFNTALENGLRAGRSSARVAVNEGARYPLGSDQGYGFGWDNIWVFKSGVHYQLNETWQLMGGYAYGQDPVADEQALFNLIAPAVVQHHVSLGVSTLLAKRHQVTLTWQRAFEGEVSQVYKASPSVAESLAGSSALELSYKASAWMSQQVVEVGYGYKF
jgi:long-chain fatty acid transport protein